jgi:uncharacterized OB-fold protein
MTRIASFGTYLPPWGTQHKRQTGPDEDALTLAVAAGRAALAGATATRVVLVTHDLPLIEGGIAAALLAALSLDPDREVVERNGGAPATLDALAGASPGTLVIAVDVEPAGAAAALVTAESTGLEVTAGPRLARSLPVTARGRDGVVHDYDDPRLLRERGLNASLERLAVGDALALAGASAADARRVCGGKPEELPTRGASSALFALAALPSGVAGTVLAVDQATVSGVTLTGTGHATVTRDELPARALPKTRYSEGPTIPISLPAYDRAFIPKLTLSAGRSADGTLTFPPRRDAISGTEPDLVPLPRRGEIYTFSTINVPVPGMATPYSLVMVELGDVGVRVLCRTTACAADEVAIGDTGAMVLRRVAVRSGVPDYQYAFLPDSATQAPAEVAS